MKADIHPEYVKSIVSCACGYTFVTRSTKPVIKVEICSNCHPFYTGRQKLIDSAGRVERFQKRFAKTEGKTITKTIVKKAVVDAKKTKNRILSTSSRRAKVVVKKDDVKETKKETKKEK